MTTIRRRAILSMVKDWQEINPTMSFKECFFLLYDDKMITGAELDYLMDWMTL